MTSTDTRDQAIIQKALQLHGAGDLAGAAALYRQVLAHAPTHFDALHLLGIVHYQSNEPAAALELFQKALSVRADVAEVWTHIGNACQSLKAFEDAIFAYRQALAINPRQALPWANLGNALNAVQRKADAITAWRQAIVLQPNMTDTLATLANEMMQLAQWQGLAELQQALLVQSPATAARVPPFHILVQQSTAAQQLAWARAFARPLEALQPLHPKGHRRLAPHDRLRIGYLSADFHNHATALLMAELFELHDRRRFEISAWSYGPEDGSALRQRIRNSVDAFHDLQVLSHADAARAIDAAEIDILVDLKGYTQDARPEILAYRPAPVQVSWLGYPGTTGARFIDYVIADPFVIPPGEEKHYSEKVIRLPVVYQPNDRQRQVGVTRSRHDYGLPEDAFVFCCFNQTYKITPDVFAVWMRLLAALPQAVLWLLEWNPWVADHLRREAAAQGIDPERLIFAPKTDSASHLARYRVADLFLDTLPVGAHTTASDALWVGLPVLALTGDTFIARVSGSLVQAAGLPELITTSLPAYEQLALALAQQPERLEQFKRQLQANRDQCALFDTPTFTRHLEAAFQDIWQDATGTRRNP